MSKSAGFARALCVSSAVASLAAASGALAQPVYPAKPIRVIVGFAAGGTSDIVARALAAPLAELLKQQVIIDNRPGAGGGVGIELTVKAPADGYTLGLGSAGPISINPHLYPKLPYDVSRDFVPVAMFANASYVLDVHPSVPARTVKELIAVGKARGGRLNYGTAGHGSTNHMGCILFLTMAGFQAQHVPYKGGAPALTDLMGGQIDWVIDPIVTTLPHVKSGRLRPLATSTAVRSALLPDLPTMSEAGVKGYEFANWFGLIAPAGTPTAVVERLNTAANIALDRPEFKELLKSQGADPLRGTVAEFSAMLKREHAKYEKLVRETGVKGE